MLGPRGFCFELDFVPLIQLWAPVRNQPTASWLNGEEHVDESGESLKTEDGLLWRAEGWGAGHKSRVQECSLREYG